MELVGSDGLMSELFPDVNWNGLDNVGTCVWKSSNAEMGACTMLELTFDKLSLPGSGM